MTTSQSRDAALDVDSLVWEARARMGSTDGEDLAFIEELEILAHSLDSEARLTAEGRVAVRNALISSLLTQLEMRRNLVDHPEIQEVHIVQPIFIIGLLRTGSTLVHNLLAQHPDLRVPNLWELMYPTKTTETHEELADKAQAYVEEYFRVAPQLKVIHFLDARRPDECQRLLGNTFQSMVYEMRYRVPGYANWLRKHDLTQAYQYHQLQLKHILWRIAGDRVVLKCPFHLWSLNALVHTYPTARFIYLHRDPTAILLSTCSLCATIRAARSNYVDRDEIGQHWLAQIERGIKQVQKVRPIYLNDKPVLDVRYDDLMRDTLGIMNQICTFIGVRMTEEAERRMRLYLANNQQGKHGIHRYAAEDFGLDSLEIDRRFHAYRIQYELASTYNNQKGRTL